MHHIYYSYIHFFCVLPLAPIDFPSCMCIFFPLFCFGSNCWNSLLAAYCMWYTSLYNYNMENIRLYLLYCVMSSRDWFETYLLMHLMYSSVMFTPNWKLILKVSKQIGKLLSIQTYHFFKWKKKTFPVHKIYAFFRIIMDITLGASIHSFDIWTAFDLHINRNVPFGSNISLS